jgi:hypothetical protein
MHVFPLSNGDFAVTVVGTIALVLLAFYTETILTSLSYGVDPKHKLTKAHIKAMRTYAVCGVILSSLSILISLIVSAF